MIISKNLNNNNMSYGNLEDSNSRCYDQNIFD